MKAPEQLWCVVLEAPHARQGGIVVSTHENDFMANDALIEVRHGQLRVSPDSRYPGRHRPIRARPRAGETMTTEALLLLLGIVVTLQAFDLAALRRRVEALERKR